MPADERVAESKIDLGIKKDQAFEKIEEWVAKTASNAKASLAFKDKKAGKLIVDWSRPCKLSGHIYQTSFKLIFEIKDKKMRVTYKDILADSGKECEKAEHKDTNPWGNVASVIVQQTLGCATALPKNNDDLADIIEDCINPLEKEIVNGLNEKPEDW